MNNLTGSDPLLWQMGAAWLDEQELALACMPGDYGFWDSHLWGQGLRFNECYLDHSIPSQLITANLHYRINDWGYRALDASESNNKMRPLHIEGLRLAIELKSQLKVARLIYVGVYVEYFDDFPKNRKELLEEMRQYHRTHPELNTRTELPEDYIVEKSTPDKRHIVV